MKILVTGAHGMLGQDLCEVLGMSHEVTGVGREDADVTDAPAVQSLLERVRPDLVLHAAAWTDVDACERSPDTALQVNGIGTLHVALAARQVGAKVAYVSTDYVFDGRKGAPYHETDRPDPVNAYGRSKLTGEMAVASTCLDYNIFRTSWLFAPHGRSFVDTVIRTAADRGGLNVVTDQVGTPAYTLDVAFAIRAVLEAGAPGLYHIANAGPCSRFEFAEEILRQVALCAIVEPTTAASFPGLAPRPVYSALATERLRREIGHEMRPWPEALADCLARRRLTTASPGMGTAGHQPPMLVRSQT